MLPSSFAILHSSFALLALSVLLASSSAAEPKFKAQDIDTAVEIGYGIALADVDGDKRTDIVLADKTTIQWYRNPSWEKFIIAEKLTAQDNVCVAAQDIDGDGKAEIAVGAGWAPADTENSGAVFYLIPPSDRTQRWTPIPLHHEPTVHRMHWVMGRTGKWELIVKPLHGRGNKNNEGVGGKVLAYTVPANPRDPWPVSVVSDFMNASHNFQPINWDADPEHELLIAGKPGVWRLGQSSGAWRRWQVTDVWAGEVRDGVLPDGKRFLAMIEPMHGTTAAVCIEPDGGKGLWPRRVLDDALKDGHAVAVADVLGKGSPQVLIGWRAMNPKGVPGVKLFTPNRDGSEWTPTAISGPEVAVEDMKAGDLDGDGKPEVILAGRATKNLRILWNRN